MSKSQEEHRKAVTRIIEFCPAKFEHQGTEHHALMMNVSRQGASFRTDKLTDSFVLSQGDELALEIKTPQGKSFCSGKVKWIRTDDEFYKWGIEFTDFPKSKEDPLWAMVDNRF